MQDLNFADLLQFFISKFFSKLLTSRPTKKQAENLKNHKEDVKNNSDISPYEIKNEGVYDQLDYEIFTSSLDTVEIISKN